MVKYVVTVREGSSLDVLTGKPDMDSLLQQRTERHRLAERPIDLAGLDHLHPGLQDTLDTWD